MKKRFTPQQIVFALRQAESGTPVTEITRKMAIYPNPATNKLYVNTNKLLVNDIKIYDLLGSCVLKQTTNNQHQITVDVGGLANAIYLLEINCTEARLYNKFVKE